MGWADAPGKETDVLSRRTRDRSGWIKLVAVGGLAAVAIWTWWSGTFFALTGIVAQWQTDIALT